MHDEIRDQDIPSAFNDPVRRELLRTWFRVQERVVREFGDGASAMIVMAAGLGRFERAPLDISSIAEITGLSRPTIRRRIRQLAAANVVQIAETPTRTIVIPTQQTLEATHGMVEDVAGQLISAGRRLEAAKTRVDGAD